MQLRDNCLQSIKKIEIFRRGFNYFLLGFPLSTWPALSLHSSLLWLKWHNPLSWPWHWSLLLTLRETNSNAKPWKSSLLASVEILWLKNSLFLTCLGLCSLFQLSPQVSIFISLQRIFWGCMMQLYSLHMHLLPRSWVAPHMQTYLQTVGIFRLL